MSRLQASWRGHPRLAVGIVIAIVCLIRLLAVVATSLELGPDESQYWRWGQAFDWGYYSKPPLIAWAIGSSTTLFGDTEWAVRFWAPIAHGIAGYALYLLGRAMFDERAGVWAAIIYLSMPGVWLSSTVMSTDALLLPLWSLGLLALWQLRQAPSVLNGVLLGAAIGAAMLAKYAALYFVLGAGLAAIVDPDTRKALLSLSGVAAFVALLAVLAPNLLWNAANDFATVGHTGDNANWSNASFDPGNLLKFAVDQLGVFGPITFGLLCFCIAVVLLNGRAPELRREQWLLCFILPPLIIIAVQAFVSRAHANWAASAYPAAAVLVGALAMSRGLRTWTFSGVALNVFVGLAYLWLALSPASANAIGADNAFKRVRGWEATTAQLGQIAADNNATAILFDEREPWHAADFYGETITLPPLRIWRSLEGPQNFAEETAALSEGEDGRVLVAVSVPAYQERIAADFEQFDPSGVLEIPIGPDRYRRFDLFIASGFAPLPRTDDYFETYPLPE